MKVLLITISIGDDYHKKYMDLFFDSHKKYAKKYDYIVFVNADVLININSPPIHNYMDYENCIGIIDDFSQPTKERRLIRHKLHGYASSASDYYKLCDLDLETDIVLNTGVMVIQPKFHTNFLQTVYDKYIEKSIEHKRGFHYEQSCVGYELQKEKNYKILDNKLKICLKCFKIYKIEILF